MCWGEGEGEGDATHRSCRCDSRSKKMTSPCSLFLTNAGAYSPSPSAPSHVLTSFVDHANTFWASPRSRNAGARRTAAAPSSAGLQLRSNS